VRKSTVAEDYFDTLLVVFGGREACQNRVKLFRVLCEMGLPTILAVFALCAVLLEPASAARGQNRVSISIARYYFRKM